MKLVLIMVLLILALMTVVGSFLINGVRNYYIDAFYEQMERTFSEPFLLQLQQTAAENTPDQLKEQVMAQPDLGIDISNRNVYILDEIGKLLTSSDENAAAVDVTANLLTAMNGEVGQSSSITNAFMDLAIPIETDSGQYIVYVIDNQSTVNALTGQVMMIILRSLAMGLIICVILAFLLAQIMITPLQALTKGTRQVAAGDFSQKLEVTSRDEIGVLTRNFNNMSQVLQNTLSEIESERDKLSTLFLHMTDGVVAFGPNGLVIQYNPASVQMLGRTLDATVTFQELFSDEASFEELLMLQRPQYLEAQKRAGSRELELFMTPFSAEQTPYGALVVIHDVTEQRKIEQMRREFVANVSHELRTPLTNIRSYAETIMESEGDMPLQLRSSFLGVIVSEADRMTRIVQDLLTLSKFDYGKMEMNIARFPFAKAVQGVYEAVVLDAQNHGHQLTLTLPDQLPEVDGDRERIEQVIMNIVSNAIKYTPDGGQIDITAGMEDKQVFVRISDNGIGIPQKDLPRLFERFYRVDKARSRASGGTGLGLSIAKEILNQHHGEIAIDSVYGEGTTVTITLPIAQ
ncbi:MAG: HAMP domain-containing protein [Clostridiales bacterium]|nr:HAMP domain-containing protein [Clostridiales bacterium]